MSDSSIHTTAVHSTPLGLFWSRWTDRGLYRLDRNRPDVPLELSQPMKDQVDQLDHLLQEFFQAGRVSFAAVTVDPGGWTDFAARTYDACRAIKAGTTATYKQLAAAAGNPNASRAVGAAMARNRVLLVIPCHRVVSTGGNLGGFSAPGGLTTKRSLLELERCGCWSKSTHNVVAAS